ncbi:peptidoglycan recognition protein family protein [Niallia sp. FSL W8-1348]|uniref:peptidoglycan recognition protein family protein n=1 Tax=Niallia sp. FSL W8-1348 TaxID=2954656 RepID=UPI0030F50089
MAIWNEDFVQKNKYSRPGLKLLGVKGIVMHWTANPGASDTAHQSFFDGTDGGGSRYAGAHIFIDSDSATLIVPLNEVAYHANEKSTKITKLKATASYYVGGNANLNTIGIEMCVEKDGTIHSETVKRSVDIVASLCKQYNLDPLKDVYRHYDITGKNCPAPWVSDSSKYTKFKNDVKSKLNGEEVKVVEPVKEEVKSEIVTKPSKATDESYVGKRVESIYKGSEGLNFYSKASWDKKYKVGTVAYGVGFPTIVDKVKVDGTYMYKIKNSKGTVYYITAASEYVKVEGETTKASTTTTKKTETKKETPKKKYIQLPKTSDSWRVYPLDKAPTKGNEKGFLNPKKFGGLEYEILGTPQANVYTIKSGDFGKVNIYGATSTGAKIVTK